MSNVVRLMTHAVFPFLNQRRKTFPYFTQNIVRSVFMMLKIIHGFGECQVRLQVNAPLPSITFI